jgi:hypothetical protein
MKLQKKRTLVKKPRQLNMNSKDLPAISLDDIILDLDKIDVSGDTMHVTGGGGVDYITIDPLPIESIDLSGLNNFSSSVTIPTTNYSPYNWTTTSSGTYTVSNTWTSSPSTVTIGTNGIDMAPGTDIKVDGKSLKTFMDKMEERLAILVPDPKKLEKFEALKKAYEHYKTMESLCFDEEKEENK